jgi:hypothetical protein
VGLVVTTKAQGTAPGSPGDLCLLADVKTELQGDPLMAGTTYDAQISKWITAATAAIVSFCNRNFVQQVYRETLPGYGSVSMTLAESPLVNVAAILFQGQALTDFSVDDPDAGTLYRQNLWDYSTQVGWVLGGLVVPSAAARDAAGAFQIDYTAGWLTPGQANPPINTGPSLPPDITKACVELVKFWYLRRRVDPDAAERRIDNLIMRYREGMDSKPPRLPRTVEWLIRPFMRIQLGGP